LFNGVDAGEVQKDPKKFFMGLISEDRPENGNRAGPLSSRAITARKKIYY
jgi:hypothetical protein